ncbi:hypothetical protein ACROYT_G027246 [Oculina patagonica]
MASLTDAGEGLRSTDGKDRFHLLTRLLMCGGVRLLREKFDSFHSPADLPLKLGDPAIIAQLKGAKLSKPEWDCLYPSPSTFGKSTNFDITLTFRLLRTICNLTTPPTGWNNLPNSTDLSLEADLARIKYYRNSIYGHNQTMEITHSEFCNLWKEISEALLRIAASISSAKRDEWKTAIDKLLDNPLTTDAQRYVDELQLWYKNDMDVKDAVEQVGDAVNQVGDAMEQVRDAVNQVGDRLQHVNVDLRDQLEHHVHVEDQLRQINQRLDHITTVIQIAVERVVVGSERTVTMAVNREQLQSGGTVGTSGEHLEGNRQSAPTEPYIWNIILSVQEYFNQFLDYLKGQLGLGVVSYSVGSLLITVTCSSLEILERLWEDYSSGHLNKVAEQNLVSPDVLEKLGLKELKLKTTITEEEYNKCKAFFLGTGQAKRIAAQFNPTMAQFNPRAGIKRSESIADVAHDLELLFPDGYETVTSMARGRELRDKRVQELMETNGSLHKGYERILKDLEQTRDRRNILKKYYQKVKDILEETSVISRAEKRDFLSEAEECIADLENERYTVLIAGETGAGKSSLINLLLNDHVLPTSIMQTTQTICEISYGPRKEAVIHFAKRSRPRTLTGSRFDRIKKYIEKPLEDEPWCEKIEIKIPNPLLEGGVVIVDSPGICDSEHVSKITLEYLPQAYAFIYVINSLNAGGLQEDRLYILRQWSKLYKGEKRSGITAESALFVCNKWDEVEKQTNQTEKEALHKHVISKLRERIPELDEKSQVVKMSVKKADEVLKRFNAMRDDLNDLINGLQRLLPLCVERKTEYFYCWISGELCNLSDQAKGEIRNAKRNEEERIKVREEVEGKLEKLKQGTPIRDIEDTISNHVEHIRQKMTSYLQLDDVRHRFCTWSDKDLPPIDETNAMKIKKIYSRCIEERFQSFLQNWENREKLFTKAHADLERRFHQGFRDFEEDIRDIDRVLVGELGDEFIPFKIRPGRSWSPLDPRKKKFLVLTLGIFMPVLIPVGLAAGVLSAPVIGYLFMEKYLQERQLRKNSIQALTELSTEFLEAFIKHEVLNHVRDKFSEETNHIASIKRCHQQVIAKYEQRCKDLTRSEDEARDKETLEKYGPFYGKLQEINQELMFDAIQNGIQVISCQIDARRLLYNERDILGAGTYGAVFKGKFTPPGYGRKDVAVKKLREVPHPSNLATFLREADMLKQLEHKHIVFFYGVVMNVHNHKLLSLELVFDLCTGSLKNHIFKNDKCIPWKTASAVGDTVQWAKQILDALEFIHSKDVIHQDLKLDNILMSTHEHIKLADLGLANFNYRITGTVCGTPFYMAPEVHEGKSYCTKVDMYSFGLIMWEMWFGKRVFSELSRSELFRRIKEENYRPQPPRRDGTFTPNPPPAEWTELMASCWQTEPSLRRTATECKNLIEEIKHQYVK